MADPTRRRPVARDLRRAVILLSLVAALALSATPPPRLVAQEASPVAPAGDGLAEVATIAAPVAPPEPTATPEPAATSASTSTPAPTVTSSLTLPTGTPSPASTTTTATATSSPTPVHEPPPAPAVTGAAAALTLRVESADVAFGTVTATGEVDRTARGVTSTTDAFGAWYVKEGAIRLTVAGEAPWSGSCTTTVAPGRLEWRLAGTDGWRPVPSATGAVGSEDACFPFRPLGTTTFDYDLRLRVARTDAPGPFAATIAFAVWP